MNLEVLIADVLESKKGKVVCRVGDDDQRRMREFWDQLSNCTSNAEFMPAVVGIEQWRPFPGQMGGNAWKVAQAVQMVISWCWSSYVECELFLPLDIKQRFLGSRSGDKNQIGYAMLEEVPDLASKLNTICRGKHEHVYDACGLAVLALERYYNNHFDIIKGA